jgi:hypothetical protein
MMGKSLLVVAVAFTHRHRIVPKALRVLLSESQSDTGPAKSSPLSSRDAKEFRSKKGTFGIGCALNDII